MQERKRKTRSNWRPTRLRGRSITGELKRKGYAARLLGLAVSLTLSACSTTPSKNIQNYKVEKTLSSICLSQEGKGRVTERKQKIYFTYETLNEPKKHLYQLIMDIPLYGSEALSVDYSNAESPIVKLEEDSQKKRKSLKNFMSFIKKFSEFIVLQQAIIEHGHKKYCDDEGAFLNCALAKGQDAFTIKKLDKMVRVKTNVGKRKSLEFEFFDLKENYFERVKAKYKNLQFDRSYFEADLFLGTCYDKQ